MENIENLGILNIDTSLYKTRLSKKFSSRKSYIPADPRLILSFIPGTVLDILVSEGDGVQKGDDLMILDAMKMQNRLKSPIEGKIKRICSSRGDRVSKGTLLIEME
ncbi:MAG: acetyl-CoA carboxylase biotin carboxyl carrier protein subunit [Bacteroidales bacterium]|jgi:biotin carboxyl carrier protein|nr:acetyl-CoA carboxylase biotin carboxyl carrier protein subunit [Bacteroidales bacterium]